MDDRRPPEAPVYAGFWLRLAAHAIDSLLICLLLAFVFIAWLLLNSTLPQGLLGPVGQFVQTLALAALTVALWRIYQATPGKMAVHLQIADAQTFGRPTTRQLVIRYLAYFVSLLPLGLGFLWVAFDARKQGWHDKLAGTVVLRLK